LYLYLIMKQKLFLFILFLQIYVSFTFKRPKKITFIHDRITDDDLIIRRPSRHLEEDHKGEMIHHFGTELHREHHGDRKKREIIDDQEAAKIRELLFHGPYYTQKERRSNDDKYNDVLHQLDLSIEDRSKLEQQTHHFTHRDKRIAVNRARPNIKKRVFFPFNAVAARIVVPARAETRSPSLSSEQESQTRSRVGEEKRDIHIELPLSERPY